MMPGMYAVSMLNKLFEFNNDNIDKWHKQHKQLRPQMSLNQPQWSNDPNYFNKAEDPNDSIEKSQVRHPDFRALVVQVLLFLLSPLLPAFADDMQVNGLFAELKNETLFHIWPNEH